MAVPTKYSMPDHTTPAALAARWSPPRLGKVRAYAAGPAAGRRALLWVVLGAVAALALLPQLGELSRSIALLATARPEWVAAGLGFVALRYMVAAVSLQVAVAGPVAFLPTLLVQLASSFVGRFTPEGVGWLVLNQRYLERAGIGRSTALAGITLKLLAGGVTRAFIALATVTAVRASAPLPGVPVTWPVLFLVGAGVASMALVVGVVTRSRAPQLLAPVRLGLRDVRAVLRQPRRAAVLFGSTAALTVLSGLALAASLLAVDITVPVPIVFAVYLGGTALAALSPTPGNIGAVEVTLSAGFAVVGVPPGSALAGVLLYRLLTFWLPVVPGFVAFRQLQTRGLL